MHWIVLSTVLLISNHDYEVQWPPDHVQRCQSLLDGAVDDEKEKIYIYQYNTYIYANISRESLSIGG